MKAMEDENRRLKRMYVDLSLRVNLLMEVLNKRIDRPSQRCALAEKAGTTRGKHCSGLLGLWDERDLLSLIPEITGRKRRDRQPAGRAD